MFLIFFILIVILIYLNVISLLKFEYIICLFCFLVYYEISVDVMFILIFFVFMVNIYISIC